MFHLTFKSSCNIYPWFSIVSSYGQTLTTSTFIGETLFAILIAILGLVLFAHLIGNMQVLYEARSLLFLFSVVYSLQVRYQVIFFIIHK